MEELNITEIDIHPHHTKGNLVKYIQSSNMDIFQPYNLCKDRLVNDIVDYIKNKNHIITFYDNNFPFVNLKEFILFLGKSPHQYSSAEKRQISDIAKLIIQFCKSGYDFNKSRYESMKEVEDDCIKISPFGDLHCVRTAVSLFNITRGPSEQIKCKVSNSINNKIQMKNAYKKNCVPSLQVKKGKWLIVFD